LIRLSASRERAFKPKPLVVKIVGTGSALLDGEMEGAELGTVDPDIKLVDVAIDPALLLVSLDVGCLRPVSSD
jgi:hypothetical protein